MSEVNNCFNCKDGEEIKLIFREPSNLAKCKEPDRGHTSGLDVANYTRMPTRKRVYLVVKENFTPTCWQERIDEE